MMTNEQEQQDGAVVLAEEHGRSGLLLQTQMWETSSGESPASLSVYLSVWWCTCLTGTMKRGVGPTQLEMMVCAWCPNRGHI